MKPEDIKYLKKVYEDDKDPEVYFLAFSMIQSEIPLAYRDFEFEMFNHKDIEPTIDKFNNYVKHIKKYGLSYVKGKGFYIFGGRGSGKSSLICVLLKELKRLNIKNVTLLVGNKFFLPAMETLLKTKNSKKNFSIDGLLLPGHLSSIVGEKVYSWISKQYKVSGVITGFEPVDLVRGIRLLIESIVKNTPLILNDYTRVVTYNGNIVAKQLIRETFDTKKGFWRGIGNIANSDAKLRENFFNFDTENRFKIPKQTFVEDKGCRCAEVILGNIKPLNCGLFAKRCSPENPIGACMVSSEGSCAAYYKYER